MSEISVEQLAEWMAGSKPFVLLDVRETREVQAVSLPGSLHIPMREIPSRLNEIDRQKDIAVLCHYGGRSELVAQFLERQGFRSVHNVEGGIDGYALRVDRALARY